jgi:hypothetical protein
MGKKETNKRAKENKKKLKEMEKQVNEESYEMERLIKIFFGVVGTLLLVYLIFAFFHGELFHKSEKTPATIQNEEILAGSAYTKQTGEYYVLFYDFDGDNNKYCDGIYNTYNNKSDKLKMYKVNLGSGLNKNYVANSLEEVNTDNNEGLKVVDATLIKFNEGKVEEVISGKDALVGYQDTLLK